MTKAERIFNNTYTECRIHVQTWGIGYNDNGTVIGFNSLFNDDDECVCTRTVNAVEKFVPGARKNIELALKYGVIDSEKASMRAKALDMVEATIKNQRMVLANN